MAKKREPTPKTRKPKSVQPKLSADGSVANPIEVRDHDDPGDETQRRYRYQHAYGVILLTGAATGRLPYQSIWCEHHDDFLAQNNGTFDSYQIKTRVPENGAWELTTEGFIAAITKFTTLEARFPNKTARFKFVSNTRTSDSRAEAKIGRSPNRLLEAASAAALHTDLKEPFDGALTKLATDCQADPKCLFNVLKRIDLILGPSLEDFEAAISLQHVSGIESCARLIPSRINAIRDELIQKVHDASSNRVDDPSKHWSCVNGVALNDPRIQAKRLSPTIVDEVIKQDQPISFRYSPIATITDNRLTQNNMSTFEKKLIRGGLHQQLETMRRRTVSTEQHLLELAASKPQEITSIRNQLESVVQGICDDAQLQQSVSGQLSGPGMLSQVQQRLQKLAEDQPNLVFDQPYDCLVGMAGLLTEACTVWWSAQFHLQGGTS
jgi:hypothetical protein